MGEQFSSEPCDFRQLVNYIDGIALWIASEPGNFEYISAGVENIWGIPAETLQNDPSRVLDGIHPDDRERVRSFMQQPAGQIANESYEGRVVRTDGTTRWVHTRQIPIRNDDGNLTRVVGITTDITEQKQREKEFAALNRILRHDIRNDLAIILGWGELLEDHLDEEGTKLLDKILSSANHVIELTEIARDYAQTIADRGDMDVKPVSLQAVVTQEVDVRREVFPEAEFRFTDPVPDLGVVANEMLTSVFRNLFNNAVQHNDTDTPIVEISFEVGDEDVVICIADNGPGIPDEQKASIFEEGERGLESSGTGIGLYLVQTLVAQYDGDVWIDDNTPTGSVFHVRLSKAS
ncbi:PAS domain-containing sensor histidine kinase [Halobellus captivus]|uniref:PAS domain-containing sensor histidine kinase n=1 Tax=Halobellus captivus TaxID=2592614 RepID=UPI00119F0D4B|nr:PAS domain-containing sensor histidine kinase [Halobellus captivus]